MGCGCGKNRGATRAAGGYVFVVTDPITKTESGYGTQHEARAVTRRNGGTIRQIPRTEWNARVSQTDKS